MTTETSQTTGATVHDLRAKQPVSYGHHITCSGCGEDVWIAVHHGRQDWCLTCQTIGPEAAIELHQRFGVAPSEAATHE